MSDITSSFRTNQRLLVLVPEGINHLSEFARKVSALALLDHRDIIYLGMVDDLVHEPAARRLLATLAALTGDASICVSSGVLFTRSWEQGLRDILQAGDRILCQGEQSVSVGQLKTLPASDFLRSAFNAPVGVLTGFYRPAKVQLSAWARSILFWLVCALIFAVFSFLEINVDRFVYGPYHLAFIGLVLIEFGMILGWNKILR